MITEWLLNFLMQFLAFALSGIPDFAQPEAWATVMGMWIDITTFAASMGHWVPWSHVLAASLFMWAAWGVYLTIKIARMVLSFVTLGGGAT